MKFVLVISMLIALGLCWSCPEKDIDFEQGGFDMIDLGPDSSWEDCGKYLLTISAISVFVTISICYIVYFLNNLAPISQYYKLCCFQEKYVN